MPEEEEVQHLTLKSTTKQNKQTKSTLFCPNTQHDGFRNNVFFPERRHTYMTNGPFETT